MAKSREHCGKNLKADSEGKEGAYPPQYSSLDVIPTPNVGLTPLGISHFPLDK
jgi:hypothetical protein